MTENNTSVGLITIIIPIYNVEKYIRDCLASIQGQTYVNFEAICVVDGSPDNSEYICREFAAVDDRFKVYVQENQGVSAARNLGLSEAKGDYICFVDADDMVDTNYLALLLELVEPDTLPICSYSHDLDLVGIDKGKKRNYDAKEFINHIFKEDIDHPNICMMLFNNSIIQMQHLDFYVGCIKNEDTEFYVKYMAHCRKIVYSEYNGYYYRPNPNSVMHSELTIKSLTSIEAQKRIVDYLVEKGIYPQDNSILSNSVQVYVYAAARAKNKEIYEYLHKQYPVTIHMKNLLRHPRLGRKAVSLLYLIVGERSFYKLLSLIRH